MKQSLLLFLAVLCLGLNVLRGQSPAPPNLVQLCVSPDSGATFQDTLSMPLAYPLLDSLGDTLQLEYLVDLELVVDLPSTTGIATLHLEIGEDLAGMYFPQLLTSFPIDGPGNMYGTYQRTGNQVKIGLSQNHITELTYKVWVEDSSGNLSTVTQASIFHLFN
ncbi:MAG: hypothetical protein ACFB10_14145 [Salibacteraceae bacterium]